MTKQLEPTEVFEKFLELRISGVNRDEAWQRVTAQAEHLPKTVISSILDAAKEWERNEGYKYHYRNKSELHDTIIRPIEPREVLEKRAQASLTGDLDPQKLKAVEQQYIEAVASGNAPTIGNPAYQDVGTAPIKPADAEMLDSSRFGPGSVLLMYFRGYPHPLDVRFSEEEEKIIGRTTNNSDMAADIDLTQLHAGEFGVSRMHAAMKRRKNQLLITDLGSLNETYINGQRLHPQEIRVLKDYDEIWFAHLTCRIRFFRD